MKKICLAAIGTVKKHLSNVFSRLEIEARDELRKKEEEYYRA